MPRTAEAGTRRVGGVGSATRAAGARHVSTQGRIPWVEFLRFRAETLGDDDEEEDDDDAGADPASASATPTTESDLPLVRRPSFIRAQARWERWALDHAARAQLRSYCVICNMWLASSKHVKQHFNRTHAMHLGGMSDVQVPTHPG